MKKGIDVSHHNGIIDWGKVKAAGVDFAIIRTGYGRQSVKQIDTQFEENYKAAKAAGVPIGAYHYSYATDVAQAEAEANFMLSLIKGKKFEYPIYFDIEEKTQAKLSARTCGNIIKAFCNKIEAAGYWAGVYSYDAFFGSNVADDIESRYALWVARVENVKPTQVTNYQMWQYSFKGKVNGINGDVDLNYCYNDYPAAIKAAGLNGYSEKPTYTITARIASLTEKQANEIMESCQKLGMSVVKSET